MNQPAMGQAMIATSVAAVPNADGVSPIQN